MPREARWECEDNGDGWTGLLHVKVDVAAKLKRALVAIEKENIQLDGVLKNIDFAKRLRTSRSLQMSASFNLSGISISTS